MVGFSGDQFEVTLEATTRLALRGAGPAAEGLVAAGEPTRERR
jgi:hypothetical protein